MILFLKLNAAEQPLGKQNNAAYEIETELSYDDWVESTLIEILAKEDNEAAKKTLLDAQPEELRADLLEKVKEKKAKKAEKEAPNPAGDGQAPKPADVDNLDGNSDGSLHEVVNGSAVPSHYPAGDGQAPKPANVDNSDGNPDDVLPEVVSGSAVSNHSGSDLDES